MIKSSKGKLKFKGMGREILADFALISMKLKELFPEELIKAAYECSKENLKFNTVKEKIDGRD